MNDFVVSVVFNNGEYRLIDFKQLFEEWEVEKDEFQRQLLDAEKFNSIRLHEGTLQWTAIRKTIQLKSGQTSDVLFDVDAIKYLNVNKRHF